MQKIIIGQISNQRAAQAFCDFLKSRDVNAWTESNGTNFHLLINDPNAEDFVCAELREFLDKTTDGADTIITEPARIPPGIRKRIALARALATDGQLVLFDEPTEALDQEGCGMIYNLLNQLAKAGKTMVICSNDPHIIKASHMHLDLNRKPVPLMTTRKHDNK